MFKQYNYKLVELNPSLKISDVLSIRCIDKITVEVQILIDPEKPDGERVWKSVDHSESLIVEFTGKFTKDNKTIWSGDILELAEAHQNAPAGLYTVSWVPGAFMAFHVHETVSVPLFDELCIQKMEHRGNQWQNSDVIQKYVDQFKDMELKAEDLPQ